MDCSDNNNNGTKRLLMKELFAVYTTQYGVLSAIEFSIFVVILLGVIYKLKKYLVWRNYLVMFTMFCILLSWFIITYLSYILYNNQPIYYNQDKNSRVIISQECNEQIKKINILILGKRITGFIIVVTQYVFIF